MKNLAQHTGIQIITVNNYLDSCTPQVVHVWTRTTKQHINFTLAHTSESIHYPICMVSRVSFEMFDELFPTTQKTFAKIHQSVDLLIFDSMADDAASCVDDWFPSTRNYSWNAMHDGNYALGDSAQKLRLDWRHFTHSLAPMLWNESDGVQNLISCSLHAVRERFFFNACHVVIFPFSKIRISFCEHIPAENAEQSSFGDTEMRRRRQKRHTRETITKKKTFSLQTKVCAVSVQCGCAANDRITEDQAIYTATRTSRGGFVRLQQSAWNVRTMRWNIQSTRILWARKMR